jgi:hypothetical protein
MGILSRIRNSNCKKAITLVALIIPALILAGCIKYGRTHQPINNIPSVLETKEVTPPPKIGQADLLKIVESLALKTFFNNTSVAKQWLPEVQKVFSQFSIFTMWGSDEFYPYPLGNIVLVDNRDGETFTMPRQFNDAVIKEDFLITDQKTALMVSKAYILIQSPGWIFIKSYKDIPWKKRPDYALNPSDYKKRITSPDVRKEGNQYIIIFSTWYQGGGEVREWEFQIEENGEVSKVESEIVASKVGDFIQSYYK